MSGEMASPAAISLSILVLLLACCQHPAAAVTATRKQAYVVYLGGHSHSPETTSADLHRVTDSHHDLLADILGSRDMAKDAIIYSYKKTINGFAATLSDQDAHKLSAHPDVVSVFPSKAKKLQTTHSWNWLSLETPSGAVSKSSLWAKAKYGSDVIIANIDTGVWPESESFSDDGFGPVPSRWKGSCENATEVACNRKLIGAKYYNKAYLQAIRGRGNMSSSLNDARDREGHGTHTLSTAGGNFVTKAKVVGSSIGTAKGGAPSARVAAYKACWPQVSHEGGCYDADIMAAFDDAIHDGADVISVSLGSDNPGDYFLDGISIGSFHAMLRNIHVVAAGGNSGPTPGSVTNLSPWLLTVAAATHDRHMQSSVELPNGAVLKGASLSPPLPRDYYPVVLSGHAASRNSSYQDAEVCLEGSLERERVEGKIVVCLRGSNARVAKGIEAARAGAAGMILCNDVTTGDEIAADLHFLPATQITYADSLTLYAYLNSTSRPRASIEPPRQVFHTKPAPEIIGFSSRGPNKVTPQILKPDISAPGVDILAAWSPLASPLDDPSLDTRETPYNIISGTSMATPHISGIVALLRSVHPDWSTAAIKSAMMTTARVRDNTMQPIRDNVDHKRTDPFAYGAGHVQPNRAMNPGLVYDLTADDHFHFLCAIGYNQSQIALVTGNPRYHCPGEKFSLASYNYPSISVIDLVPGGKPLTLQRTLKNVGPPATYRARLRNPPGVILTVQPDTLTFSKVGQDKTFQVTVKPTSHDHKFYNTHGFGELVWSDDANHVVRSPIAATFAPNN